MGSVFFVFGFWASIISLAVILWIIYFRLSSDKTYGALVGYAEKKKKKNSKSVLYAPVTEFVVNNQKYRFKAKYSSNRKPLKIGSSVTVYYRADDPLDAQLAENPILYVSFIFFIIGLVFVAVDVIFWGFHLTNILVCISIAMIPAVKFYWEAKKKWKKQGLNSMREAINMFRKKAREERESLYLQEVDGVIGFQFPDPMFNSLEHN